MMEFGPIRMIQGDTVLSPSLPRIGIRFSPDFIYLGDVQYIARETFHVEEFIFIQPNGIGHVTRLLLVHFEGYLENKKGIYDYEARPTLRLGGDDYLYDLQLINLQDYLSQRPNSDLAHAADYLRQRSYTFAGDFTLQRFIRTVSADQRNEFVILVLERNEDPSFTSADIEQDALIAKKLQDRALSSFTILHE